MKQTSELAAKRRSRPHPRTSSRPVRQQMLDPLHHDSIQSIKLKYFTAGHTLMSADNFLKGVEKEMEMNNVYDFHDFRRCVSVAGDVTLMNVSDFFNFRKRSISGNGEQVNTPMKPWKLSGKFSLPPLSPPCDPRTVKETML